jgi:hypothetical protein
LKAVADALTGLAKPWFPRYVRPAELKRKVELKAMSGETGFTAGAEGATAPETLRQKDRMAWTASGKRFGLRA